MFSKIKRSWGAGKKAANVAEIVYRIYSLVLDDPQCIDIIKRLAREYYDKHDEHELAAIFIAIWTEMIDENNPRALIEAKKYVSFMKGSYNRGLINDPMPKEEMSKIVKERFDLDYDAIEAA